MNQQSPTEEFSTYLGYSAARNHQVSISDEERARHIYTIGRTGAGKSTFQRSLVLQDILLGRGVCLIDPHGDNAAWLANCIPRHRMNDVIYFDAADRANPIGFNPLTESYDDDIRELIASELVRMFQGLFRNSWGEWLEYLLKHSLLALLAYRGGAVSLLSIQRLLEDSDYRKRIVGQLTDPTLARFWERYINRLQERQLLERISSTINKTGKFSLSTVLRNIVGQSRSGFSMQQAMERQQIVLVNLAKGEIGEDNANFLGSLLVANIIGQAMRRNALPLKERTPFHLVIDEFQNFTTDQFASIVSEARKYGLRLAVAHQTFDQVEPKVLDQILKNAEILTAFGVGFEDADRLESSFRPVRSDALSGLRVGEFYLSTSTTSPSCIYGHTPTELNAFQTNSLERVQRNSRWRFARPRAAVERDILRWYGATS